MDKLHNDTRDKIIAGMKLVHERLIKEKKEKNIDLVISENGKVVRIPARDL
jgi:hypothetical protein